MIDQEQEKALARYVAQAEEARRNAQIAREEADVTESFQRSALLHHEQQLLRQAERYDGFAEEIRKTLR